MCHRKNAVKLLIEITQKITLRNNIENTTGNYVVKYHAQLTCRNNTGKSTEMTRSNNTGNNTDYNTPKQQEINLRNNMTEKYV